MSFDKLFSRIPDCDLPGYMYLLNMGSRKAMKKVVALTKEAVESSRTPETDVLGLLKSENWRDAAVGAVATLFLQDNVAAVGALWDGVRTGSWVSPQMLVVLERIDKRFDQTALAVLEELDSRGTIRGQGRYTPEVHSRKGADTPDEATSKAIGAMRGLLTARGVLKIAPVPSGEEDWASYVLKLRDELARALTPGTG